MFPLQITLTIPNAAALTALASILGDQVAALPAPAVGINKAAKPPKGEPAAPAPTPAPVAAPAPAPQAAPEGKPLEYTDVQAKVVKYMQAASAAKLNANELTGNVFKGLGLQGAKGTTAEQWPAIIDALDAAMAALPGA